MESILPAQDGQAATKVGRDQRDGSYKVTRKRLESLLPSRENDAIYRPIDPDDDDFRSLVESIKKHGVQQPLVVTRDRFIVSGHRRHAAADLAGKVWVPCHVLPIRRRDMSRDEYVALLREHNRQRHKSISEQMREAMVDANPDAAHAELQRRRLESRQKIEVLSLKIEGQSRRFGISDEKSEHVEHVRRVIFHDRRQYWPLSVRGVHYALLNFLFFRNTKQRLRYLNDKNSYKATSDLLTRLRVSGDVPWQSLSDGTRPAETFSPFKNAGDFWGWSLNGFATGYWRDLLQSQPSHVECLVEKNTVLNMALEVTREYQIPTVSGRGFGSIDALHDIYERYLASKKERLTLVVLSDFDPEGEQIPHVAGRVLIDDFGVDRERLQIVKAGVTRLQIDRYNLPPMAFAKETSSNRDWFVARNDGDENVYELEALEPAAMMADLRAAIESVIDRPLFNAELDTEREEAVKLMAARTAAIKTMRYIRL